MGAVFILNGIALFAFPPLGHALDMSQQQFGAFAALAIHDTSSVVGAAAQFGESSLGIATLLKLTRALWILPLVFLIQWGQGKTRGKRPAFPAFIFGFLGVSALFTFVAPLAPWLSEIRPSVQMAARVGLAISLFLIGASIDLQKLKALGAKTLAHALLLWAGSIGLSYVVSLRMAS
jgi:uncharacterized membrane protein YadS